MIYKANKSFSKQKSNSILLKAKLREEAFYLLCYEEFVGCPLLSYIKNSVLGFFLGFYISIFIFKHRRVLEF